MAGQSVPLSRTLHLSSPATVAAAKEINPQPAPTSVGHAQYNCTSYSTCLGIAAEKGWTGLSCAACTAYRPVPSEAIPYDACAQLLGAVLRTAQHDLEHGLDDSFWEAATFVFHQPDFAVLSVRRPWRRGPPPSPSTPRTAEAARQAQWTRLTSAQRRAIAERWPQATRALH